MIPDGSSLMIGEFMGVGTPECVIDEFVRQGKRALTVIANDTARPGLGIGKLVSAKLAQESDRQPHRPQPRAPAADDLRRDRGGRVPQGTLIERIRAGGCGLGGVLTPTGVGTVVEEGKRKIALDGKEYLIEPALRPDFALLQAFLSDYLGGHHLALPRATSTP